MSGKRHIRLLYNLLIRIFPDFRLFPLPMLAARQKVLRMAPSCGCTCHRVLRWALLLALVLPMTSCRRATERALSKIRVEEVVKLERQGLSGAELVLRVKNATGHKLVLERAVLRIYYAENLVTSIALRGRVEVPRRSDGEITTLWRTRTSDPMALYVMRKKLAGGDLSRIAVSFSIDGRGGPAPVNISQEMMPLSDFLNIFGLSFDEVKTYLKEECAVY